MKDLPKLDITDDIGQAWTLPAGYYTDPDVFALEEEKLFRRTWQVVGHRNQLVKPGDYFTTELAGEPLLLVRGAGGKLRINDGVTRATRAAKLKPGALVPAEVIQNLPKLDLTRTPKVKEMLP